MMGVWSSIIRGSGGGLCYERFCINEASSEGTDGYIPDNNTLVFTINHHVSIHVVCQGIYVRWVFILGLRDRRKRDKMRSSFTPCDKSCKSEWKQKGLTHGSLVEFDFPVSEVGHLFEGVYRYQDRADVRLNRSVKYQKGDMAEAWLCVYLTAFQLYVSCYSAFTVIHVISPWCNRRKTRVFGWNGRCLNITKQQGCPLLSI